MRLVDVTVNFTINNVVLFALAGAFGGLLTGSLMKAAAWRILADLVFGALGGLIAVFVIGGAVGFGQYGPAAEALLALLGGVLLQVFARITMTVRRRSKAAS